MSKSRLRSAANNSLNTTSFFGSSVRRRGEMVDMRAWGQAPIEQLQVGDEVYAFDEESGEVVVRTVERTFENITDRLVELRYAGGNVAATMSHPFWVENAGWLAAKDVTKGMRLRTPGGSAEVLAMGASAGERIVYNLAVSDEHNYFAGTRPVLVHNQEVSFPNYNEAVQHALEWLRAQGVDTATVTQVREARHGMALTTPGAMRGSVSSGTRPRARTSTHGWARTRLRISSLQETNRA
jgi:hypothetical protein